MEKKLITFLTLLIFFSCTKNKNGSTPPVNTSEVIIGTQTWTTRNLDVSYYRNGDPIPQVTDPAQWAALTTGAWCYKNNDPAMGAKYGKLYNWFAVNDPRGIAPAGWHIPSDAEWSTLTTFLGGETISGGKMKATILWESPNTGATNSSGFTALPGSYRYSDGGAGPYTGFGEIWWSNTENSFFPDMIWCRGVWNDHGSVIRNFQNKGGGFAVRCIKD